MMTFIRYSLLLLPLCWYVLIWDSIVFNGSIPRPTINNYPPWVDGLLVPIFWLVITPLSFFIGSIYTAYKKLWWWFAAYMILGFGFWVYLRI
ncbi:hypothetical protein [Vibrio aquimaris]|uniref:Uncharacterized protein n=1 Tax=Vibrio aquimaris TaxID=2587862 RepID=A0A5P9CK63_9VIBR|nr:hypothetical protein [Vibrio aquimaris]QFT25942.1 hypothetical protein FIV01_05840 [Vibrio aquimaris]